MAATWLRGSVSNLLKILLFLTTVISTNSQLLAPRFSCDCNEEGAVAVEVCDSSGQCFCKAGVGGLKCNVCLPGYADQTPKGCRNTSCPPRVSGDTCDVCSFGYHEVLTGCIPCPVCYDEIALQLNTTLDQYVQLLTQLNSTLGEGGGVNITVLARIEGYRQTLERFLQRARVAIMREGILTSFEGDFFMIASSLRDEVDQFLLNLTMAETVFSGLESRLNGSLSFYGDLVVGVADLDGTVRQDLRQLMQRAITLSQELIGKVVELMGLSTDANIISMNLRSQANSFLEQIELAFYNASMALQNLQSTVMLQNQTLVTVQTIDAMLSTLEALADEGREALGNATRDVPIALTESSGALAAVLNISLDDSNLSLIRNDVEQVQNEFSSVNASLDEIVTILDVLKRNLSLLNDTALMLLTESRSLTDEAVVLLARSRRALSLGNESTLQGNAIINEASELLNELQRRFYTAGDLSVGLDEVLRNIEEAERLSLLAEGDAVWAEEGITKVTDDVNAAVRLLEEVSQTLSETLKLVSQLNIASARVRNDATSLSSESTDLIQEVTMATEEVDQLEQAVMNDRDATTAVTETATDTISAARDINERLILINNLITNLTTEFNETSLLLPDRLREVNATVVSLETEAERNQVQVNLLTGEIQRLQESSDVLRERYIMLQQHRDLLQEILDNIEPLNCLEQFQV